VHIEGQARLYAAALSKEGYAPFDVFWRKITGLARVERQR